MSKYVKTESQKFVEAFVFVTVVGIAAVIAATFIIKAAI